MPHFEANRQVILKAADVPSGYTIEDIAAAMKDKQFPIKFRKGAVSYEIGQIVRADLGRDSIVGDLGLDPEFKLIFEKLHEESEIEGEPDKEYVVVKHLEWT